MGLAENSEFEDRAIMQAALELTDVCERKAFLDETCGVDSPRRHEVERLLAAHFSFGDFSSGDVLDDSAPSARESYSGDETKAHDVDISLDFDVAIHPTIDRYKLLEPIGEGGMGVVYMAQQTEPVKRRVALKLIKPGMDSREVIARFEAERQALALMDHPHIASVLDAGTTAEGRPYFVMELVPGIPITYYCDYNHLGVEKRLRLLIDVCHAVQHAHQKGIIHRDLKPSNVLVTLHDSVPMVKVIDFGVAKALHQELTEQTIFTKFSQMVGTPIYMSPEQAEMNGLDIDTRSDVYSLGVLLYELLTGTTPFDKETFSRVGLDGMRRMICDEEPLRPSTRVSMFQPDRLTKVSEKRCLNTKLFRRTLRGDLDWIVMRALEKDRDRRYESASMLAADLQRYLDNEPVSACPPTVLYRFRKMTRRHRSAFVAATFTLVLMLVGMMVSYRYAVRALEAEHAARMAQREAEQTAEDMRKLLYASDVMLASQAWRHNDIQQARVLLSRHIPKEGQSDLRGFEWHFLWNQQSVFGREIADFGSAIYDIALSPSGNLMAVTGAGAEIQIFDMESGQRQFTISTGQVETNGIEFSPDSRFIAATGDDGTLRVWDLETRQEKWNTLAYDGKAFQVRFSPDGKVLVTCGEHNEVRRWDAATGAFSGTLNEHDDWLETIAMSPSGIVAAGDRMSRITLWDAGQGGMVRDLGEQDPDPVSSVRFSANGHLAFGTVGGLLTIADAQTNAITSQKRIVDGIQSLDFSPTGSWLAVGDRAGILRMLPFERGRWDLGVSREWQAHLGRVYALRVTPDGHRILSGGADGRFMAWEPLTGGPERIVHIGDRVTDIAAVDDQRFVVSGDDFIAVYDRSGEEVSRIRAPGHWVIHRTTAAGRIFGRCKTEVAAWDVDSGEQVFQWQLPDEASMLEFSPAPDGQTVFLAFKLAGGDRYIQLVSVRTRMILAEFPAQTAHRLDVSSDGLWLAYDSNNDIQLFDIKNRRHAKTFFGHQGAIRSLQFTTDGLRLGSLSADRTLRLWSVPSGNLEYSVIAHRTDTVGLAITPDGRRIATAGKDRMLRLWDGQRTEPLWEYPLPMGQLSDLCFSADSERLLCLCGAHDLLILDGSPRGNLDAAPD